MRKNCKQRPFDIHGRRASEKNQKSKFLEKKSGNFAIIAKSPIFVYSVSDIFCKKKTFQKTVFFFFFEKRKIKVKMHVNVLNVFKYLAIEARRLKLYKRSHH